MSAHRYFLRLLPTHDCWVGDGDNDYFRVLAGEELRTPTGRYVTINYDHGTYLWIDQESLTVDVHSITGEEAATASPR